MKYALSLNVAPNGVISGPGTRFSARKEVRVKMRGRVSNKGVVTLRVQGGSTLLIASTGQVQGESVTAAKWSGQGFGAWMKGKALALQRDHEASRCAGPLALMRCFVRYPARCAELICWRAVGPFNARRRQPNMAFRSLDDGAGAGDGGADAGGGWQRDLERRSSVKLAGWITETAAGSPAG